MVFEVTSYCKCPKISEYQHDQADH